MRILTILLTLSILIGCSSTDSKKDDKPEPNLLADREAPLGWVYLKTYPDSSFEFISAGLRDRTIYPGKYSINADTIFFKYTDSIPKLNSTKAIFRNNSIVYLDGTYREVLSISKNNLTSIKQKSKIDSEKNTTQSVTKYSDKVIPKRTKFKYFEVSYLDFYKGNLSRVFISIDTSNIFNKTIIQSIICDIKSEFDVEENTNISFFSELKYADYKTNLFVFENHTLPKEEYENWMDYYYLAEFDFSTMEYRTYPSCRTEYKRQKTTRINC